MHGHAGSTLYTGHSRELRVEAARTLSCVRLRPIELDIGWDLWLSVVMARPIRVEFEGAVYHVMARGNQRRPIFRDDQDRRQFLDALGEMAERFGVLIHLYCLIPNHYHLAVETPRGNLSRAVGWLQVTYTVRFNRRHRRSGHLFQGRFKAQLVEADEYARALVCYVHLNPVRPRDREKVVPAERAAELARYPWSSHLDYAGLRAKSPDWLNLEWLRYWGRSPRMAHEEYRREIKGYFGRPVASPWEKLRGGLVLGTERLWRKVCRILKEKEGQEEILWRQRVSARETGEQVRKMLEREPDERVRIWARMRLGGERGAEMARELGYRDGSGVGQVVRRLEREAAHDADLQLKLDRLRASMSSVQS